MEYKNPVSVANPIEDKHAANKQYVDDKIDDTVISSGKTWSSEKINKINVSDAKKVDSKPTYADGTITYIKDGASYTTTNSKQWFYYLENGSLKQTIFIDGEELTIDGASVDFDEYVKKTSITDTLDSNSTNEQVAGAKVVYDALNNKLTKSSLVELEDIGNGSRGMISTWHLDGIGDYMSLDIIDKDGKLRRLQFNNGNSLKWLEIYNFDGTNWKRIGNVYYTNIDNVGTTQITPTFPSTISVANNYICYSIKNGWANVEIAINVASSTAAVDWCKIATGLPKPDKEINNSSSGENTSGINVGFIINASGELLLKIKDVVTDADWWNVNVSYPVAES